MFIKEKWVRRRFDTYKSQGIVWIFLEKGGKGLIYKEGRRWRRKTFNQNRVRSFWKTTPLFFFFFNIIENPPIVDYFEYVYIWKGNICEQQILIETIIINNFRVRFCEPSNRCPSHHIFKSTHVRWVSYKYNTEWRQRKEFPTLKKNTEIKGSETLNEYTMEHERMNELAFFFFFFPFLSRLACVFLFLFVCLWVSECVWCGILCGRSTVKRKQSEN